MKGKTIVTAVVLIISMIAVIMAVFQTGIELDKTQHNALMLLVKVALAASIYCIIASELTGNYSQVDRLWSTIPVAYAWIVSFYDGFEWRSLVAAILITLWGIRLSYNFALKGGFSWLPWKGEEDYRWAYLRQDGPLKHPVMWRLFNIFFISFYQMALILYFTLPVLLTINSSGRSFGWLDGVAYSGFVLFLILETTADLQQYRYQTEKNRQIHSGAPVEEKYRRGFIRSGLWAWVRHPNYLAEQMIWLMVYLMGVAATGNWFNWTLGGCVLLVLLFRGSSDFSEKISAGKYPEYSRYQKEVGRFLPKLKF